MPRKMGLAGREGNIAVRRTMDFRHDGSNVRSSPDVAQAPRGVAGRTHGPVMRVDGSRERANEGHAVHPLGDTRKILADLDAWHAGSDGPKFPAKLHRGIRLHVESVQMRGAAGQPDIDDRSLAIRGINRGACIGPQEIRKRQTRRKPQPPVGEAHAGGDRRTSDSCCWEESLLGSFCWNSSVQEGLEDKSETISALKLPPLST